MEQCLPGEEEGNAKGRTSKETRSIYWHVPIKENTTPTGVRELRKDNGYRGEDPARGTRVQVNTGARRLGEAAEPTAVDLISNRPDEQRGQGAQNPNEAQAPIEATDGQTSPASLADEVWETPATQDDTTQQRDPTIDPQLVPAEEAFFPTQQEDGQFYQPRYPLEGIEGAAMQEADIWLHGIANDNGNDWLYGPTEIEPSPLTSMATDTRTALGTIYKGCNCPSHQEIYKEWPIRNAELTIARCMRVCVYCGKDFSVAAALRQHMRKRPEYAQRNLTVRTEAAGMGSSSTPGWTSRLRAESPSPRPLTRVTRSQSLTNSTNVARQSW